MTATDPARRFEMTVAIPTVGRSDVLANTLRDLATQRGVAFEVVIVNQGDDPLDAAAAVAKESGLAVRCFHQPEPNASLARNVALREALAEIVLFLDDDMALPNEQFLAAHLRCYCDSRVAGVAGQVLGPGAAARTRPLHRWASHPRTGWLYTPSDWCEARETPNGISCNLSVRRDWAVDVGGMDARFERGAHREESDFCLRLTAKYGPLRFEPQASAVHLHVPSGGCRSWNNDAHGVAQSPNTYAEHHLTGEWYFLWRGLQLGTIKLRDLHHYLAATFRRQIWNRPNGRRWRGMGAAIVASTRGLFCAVAAIRKGPRCIGSVESTSYSRQWAQPPNEPAAHALNSPDVMRQDC
ncbi:MAG: glycosyltransferase family 2 protein [Planctomycetales bacterium]|nr:glycosyltransferase family 2 protein [Planctomycetales bacterium]